jgi:acyl transferase domain-containing protein/acyl carrier protein
MSTINGYNGLEIAIIGISAKFPSCRTYREYWQNLREGKEFLRRLTDEELRARGMSESIIRDKKYVRTAGDLDDKDCFDSSFFEYTPEEASLMDPQTRLLHEHCWHALEDAGYTSQIEEYRIGLYAGASLNDNWKIYSFSKSATASIDPFFQQIITSQTFINTLISYKLNLRGPSYFIDTACSTSLSAIHLACRSLLTRDCTLALAGGISISTRIRRGYRPEDVVIGSKDGYTRTFDSLASGPIFGDGVGMVVLKRLTEALKDGDQVYAVIKATASNNDGNRKVGFTAPSVRGQADCIASAIKLAGIAPDSIGYVEAHGTATRLGDPIEIRALNEAFATGGENKYCAIGSVKTNMGHLDAAAGVAGIIKTALSLKNKEIPASLNFREANPEIEFERGPFYVNTGLKEWRSNGDSPLRAGVSSLGIGGTNVHAILEEAPESVEFPSGHKYKLLTTSAKTPASLENYLTELHSFLLNEPETSLADMAYTLQAGRKHFAYRKSIVYSSREDILLALSDGRSNKTYTKSYEGKSPIVFMFPGQGSQYTNMCIGLYAGNELFRDEMNRGFSLLAEQSGIDYKQIIFPGSEGKGDINQTVNAQPLIFLTEYCLARVLMSLGVTPQYMIGHSIGEYVAACISGVFSFEDALKLVAARGKLMNRVAPGSMLSVPISAASAKAYLDDCIFLAAVNGPESVVLSGQTAAMENLVKRLSYSGVPHVKLHTSHAFHSGMQDEILDDFRKQAETITYNKPKIAFISNLTGTFILPEEAASPVYWVRHLRETVKFSAGLTAILSCNESPVFIEVGAGHALTALLEQHPARDIHRVVGLVKSAKKKDEDDLMSFTKGIGSLWSHGVGIDWKSYYNGEQRKRISLPTYVFERTRYPAEVDPIGNGFLEEVGLSGDTELKDWIYFPSWRRSILNADKIEASPKTYLVLSQSRSFTAALRDKIVGKDIGLVEVYVGAEYKKLFRDEYEVDPANPQDFSNLAMDLLQANQEITDVVYAWGGAAGSTALDTGIPGKDLELVFFSIAGIVRSLLRSGELKHVRFSIITNGLYRVIGSEEGPIVQSLMIGPAIVLPQEFQVSCLNIDIDLNESPSEWAENLADELRYNDGTQDRTICFRNNRRWVQTYEKNTRQLSYDENPIKNGGGYLITGGLGNLGFLLARHLVEKYNARLILTGRREIRGHDQALERLSCLSEMGGDVRYIAADVSDPEAFERAVREVEEGGFRIDGVIHAAGIIDKAHFELLEDVTMEKAMSMFAPKIKGIQNIHTIFKDRDIDFVWAASSLATVLGGLGYAAYSSANAYMDHFLSSAVDPRLSWKCVDLPGLAFDEEEHKDPVSLFGADIVSLFEWSLGFKNCPVIVVSKGSLLARIKKVFNARKTAAENNLSESGVNIRRERPQLAAEAIAATTETELRLKSLFEEFFAIQDIGVEDGFFELGGDSLKGMILLKRIKQEFNIVVSLQDFLFNSTIKRIAEKIDEATWLTKAVHMENEITI